MQNLPKILTVDDSKENLISLRAALGEITAEIYEASSGEEALSMTLRHEFAIILLDIQMPGMNGYETATLLRQNKQTRYTPIIFLTAIYKEKQNVFQGYEAGAVDYLMKPLDMDILIPKVNVFLELYNKTKAIENISIELEKEITHRKRAEAEQSKLQAKVRKMQTMESLRTLVDGVAHEFNNILGVSLSYLDMILKQSVEEKPKRSHLKVARDGVQQAVNLVKQMRFLGCENERCFKRTELHPVMVEAIENVRSTVPDNVTLRTSVNAQGIQVLIDEIQIKQMLNCLSDNAIQAMGATEGTLMITLDKVELNQAFIKTHPHMEAGSYLRLSIYDTGIGIEPQSQDNVFDPFFTTKEVGHGSGLGLSMVYGIVKEHDGFVTVHSSPGQGSAFYVYLPVVEDAVSGKTTSEPGTLFADGTIRVLLLEEDQEMGYFGKCMLEQLGYEATLKTTCSDALTEFRENTYRYDTLIVSQTLMDTYDLRFIKKLHEIRPDIPIVLATPYGNQLPESLCQKAGIRITIKKPYILSDFKSAITSLLAHESPALEQ